MPKLASRPPNQSAPGDVLVCSFLRGGIGGLSAIVPYGDGANYYDIRPTIAVPEPGSSEKAAIDLNGYFGLNPALAPIYDIYSAGKLAVIHATGSMNPSR